MYNNVALIWICLEHILCSFWIFLFNSNYRLNNLNPNIDLILLSWIILQQQSKPGLIRDQHHRQQPKQKQTHVHQEQLVKGNTRELLSAERNKVDGWKAVMGNHALLSLLCIL